MGEVHILHANVNGLRSKQTEAAQYLADTKPDIVCLNETRLCGAKPPRLSGYRVVCCRDRTVDKLRGGGVAIYVRNGLLCSDISPDMDDVAAVEFTAGRQKYAVVSYYCPPPGGNIDLNVPMIEQFARQYDRLILVGDLNAKHQYFGSSRTNARGEALFDLVERYDMWVANDPSQATRHDVATGDCELLDYAIVSKELVRYVVHSYVGDDISSDHLPLHLVLRVGTHINTLETRKIRPLAKCDWSLFRDNILRDRANRAVTALDSEASIDVRCGEMGQSITRALDAACPLRTVKEYSFRVSSETLKLIRLKRKLRRKCQKDPAYRNAYEAASRRVKEAVLVERKQAWERATGRLNEDNGHEFWRTFKRLTGTSKCGARRDPRLALANGQLTDDPAIVCEEFAASLERIHNVHEGPEFDAETKIHVEEHVRSNNAAYVPSFGAPNPPESWLDDAVTIEELSGALAKCRNRSAPGPDGITYEVLKKVPTQVLSDLATLYTACISHGYFPKQWKEAYGIMLTKPNKDSKRVTNYRPISLLNTMGKLFERIVGRRLQEHLSEQNFFNDWQRAYQSKKEAAEIVYRLGEEVRTARKTGWITAAISLDVEKAFDSVWHNGLRYKLSELGLPGRLLRLLSSFLTDRTIKVRVGHNLSKSVALRAGTPQGSVLSPLLFLIYVNDIPLKTARNCRAGQFADDVNIWASSRNQSMTYAHLQRALKLVEGWCSKWRIKLNVAKTQLITFTTNRGKPKQKLKLFDQEIDEQKELTVLGVTFDKRCSFAQHCRSKAAKAMQRTNLLRAVSGKTWGANTKTLLQLYRQYVRPVMEYGGATTAKACKSAMQVMRRVEHKAMRIALKAPLTSKISALYDTTGLTPLHERLSSQRRKAVSRFGDSTAMKQLKSTKELMDPTTRRTPPPGESQRSPERSTDHAARISRSPAKTATESVVSSGQCLPLSAEKVENGENPNKSSDTDSGPTGQGSKGITQTSAGSPAGRGASDPGGSVTENPGRIEERPWALTRSHL